ncbi:carbamoyltransferase HypF [Gilliamella sp. Nev6-6]|uniref:carbamoyltransferase HypF n=1 Tax=unclassified Gilliamella TaxID=2685620 RepID=UPI00080E8EA7|nr:carbamoyltransferase HypF [Gilliamella apicola]OCG60489.1 carbamoyltransferase HypF [Gilliamella apicola]OCG66255.1 carbamoyltransferase HypF [Gilliamella apicola]OCG73254.1 carbamoyltransferase HypF [Gilliamella apicola]
MVQNFQGSVEKVTKRYRVSGIVQGVGFRPFVHRLAKNYGVNGWVLNDSEGVLIELQSSNDNIALMMNELVSTPPPLARIINITIIDQVDNECYQTFSIRKSLQLDHMNTIIPPDSNVCNDCLSEMRDSENIRYRYAFINCTNCGPRYSIIKDMPYDRSQSTMSSFKMCPSCQHEYNNIDDRRYHAQPNACPICGPELELVDHSGKPISTDDIVRFTIKELKEGKIVAIKSLGGFHLVVDASNTSAVKELRKRKKRDAKPFAVMAENVDNINNFATVEFEEKILLESPQRPIVLLQKRKVKFLEDVAPHNPNIGVMLPSAPLHYLLLEDPTMPVLVMTSGNLSGYPIVYDNKTAVEQLGKIADYFILNNRDIHTRVDDSVARIMINEKKDKNQMLFLRRSRGYAPYPIHLAYEVGSITALGAELKTTISLSKDKQVFMSQHIGDLKNDLTFDSHKDCISHLKKLLGIETNAIACDLHPMFRSTRTALNQLNTKVIQVQHHHAHMASCMAENGLLGQTIGVIFDGTGYGTDGSIWGGEFLIGDFENFSRAACLRTIRLIGGDKAIKEPLRIAVSLLTETFGDNFDLLDIPALNLLSEQQRNVFTKMSVQKINSAATSSIGRLFDGVSALMGVCTNVEYEGQAAIELESLLERDLHMVKPFKFRLEDKDGHIEIDYRPMIKEITFALLSTEPNLSEISRCFHSTIVEIIKTVCKQLASKTGCNQIVLSGGVFCNEFILMNTIDHLEKIDLKPYSHKLVPTNDGGISLGQIVVAAPILNSKG